jgi:hypothetical protein
MNAGNPRSKYWQARVQFLCFKYCVLNVASSRRERGCVLTWERIRKGRIHFYKLFSGWH